MYHNFSEQGLNDLQVLESRKRYGSNALEKTTTPYWPVLKDILLEPMFLLLLTAAGVYFILGEQNEGLFMLGAIILVSAISFFQDSRSRKALESLKRITQVKTKVLRNGKIAEVEAEEVVVGDLVVVEEGNLIPADGKVIQCNDFSVNESLLTGESFGVFKSAGDPQTDRVFQGTITISGLALIEATAIGTATEFARIGQLLKNIPEEKTPLQVQIQVFVKRMAIIGVVVFLGVWIYNIVISGDVLDSLVKGLTLAMSVLPEEIPVAFTTFMALGAWRLMKSGVVVKQIKTVETLGSATVICADKTGTITENRMQVTRVYVHATGEVKEVIPENAEAIREVVEAGMWASEPVPFDPMEIALHEKYGDFSAIDLRQNARMIHEYPLGGVPPIMTHVFALESGTVLVAAKGSPEGILNCSRLSGSDKNKASSQWKALAAQGLRVLGVARASAMENFPEHQQEFLFDFLGFVAFYDPPKENISSVFESFYNAGIQVKIITGDTTETTSFLAEQINFQGREKVISGQDLMQLDDQDLSRVVQETHIFTRMFPEAKLRIIQALKAAGEIVAMTGDGVNDGPALKASHIGVAMGKAGSEVARQASALILIAGDLSKMVEAVAQGRKIYANLKKAIQYIISIHIPIILTVALPLFLGWKYPFIFTPVHVIFLELIMGPTCSIVYENEPLEENQMFLPPRRATSTFLQWHELRLSLLQGLVITAVIMSVYWWTVGEGASEERTRTMVFATLVFANIFLTLSNRSFTSSVLRSLKKKNDLIGITILVSVLALLAVIYIKPFQTIFEFKPMNFEELMICFIAGMVSVFWFEIVKVYRRKTGEAQVG